MARKSPKRLSASEIGDMRQKLKRARGMSWLRCVRRYRFLERLTVRKSRDMYQQLINTGSMLWLDFVKKFQPLKYFGKKIGIFWPLSLLLFGIISWVFIGLFYASVSFPEWTLNKLGIQDKIEISVPAISSQESVTLSTETKNVFDKLGPVGDFFGGIINPILTFISICLLLLSLKTQRDELASTRAELARTAKANEDLVNLQREQTLSATRSANSLSRAADAQMRSYDMQTTMMGLQRTQIILETKISLLKEINYQIESRKKDIQHFIANPQDKETTHGDRVYWPNKEELDGLEVRKRNLEREIQSIESTLR
jgi:hypothetical protein